MAKTTRRHGYQPGRIAKLSVAAAAAAYAVDLCLGGAGGAGLGPGASLKLAVPFVAVVPAWAVGHVACFLGRRRQRAGDVGFGVSMLAIAAAVLAGSHAR